MIGTGRLERYVLARAFAGVAAALAVVTSIVFRIQFVDLSRDVGAGADVGLTLVLGATRSGKSAHAEGLAQASGLPVRYLATADPDDVITSIIV